MTDDSKPDLHLLESVPVVSESGHPDDDGEDGGEALSAREIRFVDALAVGRSPSEAAREIGLSDRSGRRWRKKPEIIEAVRARLSENIATAKSILASGAAKAATGLVEMASGEKPAEAARIAACRSVVENATKMIDLAEIERQLSELQARLATQPNHQFRS
jgi:methylphosphotriester-DNA--protein-cysteine methyltransferase